MVVVRNCGPFGDSSGDDDDGTSTASTWPMPSELVPENENSRQTPTRVSQSSAQVPGMGQRPAHATKPGTQQRQHAPVTARICGSATSTSPVSDSWSWRRSKPKSKSAVHKSHRDRITYTRSNGQSGPCPSVDRTGTKTTCSCHR